MIIAEQNEQMSRIRPDDALFFNYSDNDHAIAKWSPATGRPRNKLLLCRLKKKKTHQDDLTTNSITFITVLPVSNSVIIKFWSRWTNKSGNF